MKCVNYFEKKVNIHEAICLMETKINELVDAYNRVNADHEVIAAKVKELEKLIDYLLGAGLEAEVKKKLEEWLADGTLANIIGDTLDKWTARITKLETDVTSINSQLEGGVNKKNKVIQKKEGIFDYTSTIQDAINTYNSIEFESGEEYPIYNTINIDVTNFKKIIGNNAKIKMCSENEDKLCFNIFGSLNGSANPNQSDAEVGKKNFTIDNLRITSLQKGKNMAVKFSSIFSPIVDKCDFYNMKTGIIFEKMVRNAIVSNSNFYGNVEDNLLFNVVDLHQINILGNHISYSKRNIFFKNCNIYNCQITGNDIEVSSYPLEGVEGNIIFRQTTGICEDIEIVGNTIEDHWCGQKLIEFNGNKENLILGITINGNVIGNSKNNDIYLKNVKGCSIVGNSFKNTNEENILLDGTRNENLIISNNNFNCNTSTSCILKANNQNMVLKTFNFSNNSITDLKNYCLNLWIGYAYSVNISNNLIFTTTSNSIDYINYIKVYSIIELMNISNNMVKGRETNTNSYRLIVGTKTNGVIIKNNLSLNVVDPYYLPTTDLTNSIIVSDNLN